MLAIVAGLVIGKPLGLVLACVIAVKIGWAVKPQRVLVASARRRGGARGHRIHHVAVYRGSGVSG